MNRNDYIEEIKNDVIQAIRDNYNEGDVINKNELYDDLFIDDSVTGNGSGSYTFSSYDAKMNVIDDLEELVEEIEFQFGEIPSEKRYDWEYIDVSVRCALLGEAIEEAMEELEDSYEWED